MTKDSSPILVYISTSNQNEAENIANYLVENHLVACVNIIPAITSVYRWEGKVQKDSELLLICKTNKEKYKLIERLVLEMHSYDNPEIICTDISCGSPQYLNWIKESLNEG